MNLKYAVFNPESLSYVGEHDDFIDAWKQASSVASWIVVPVAKSAKASAKAKSAKAKSAKA